MLQRQNVHALARTRIQNVPPFLSAEARDPLKHSPSRHSLHCAIPVLYRCSRKLCLGSSLGKDGSERDGDGADVHEEEETVEQTGDQSPVARHPVLPLGVVQPAQVDPQVGRCLIQVDPQVAVDVADVAFETSSADGPESGGMV